jgi:hypothetical protein
MMASLSAAIGNSRPIMKARCEVLKLQLRRAGRSFLGKFAGRDGSFYMSCRAARTFV